MDAEDGAARKGAVWRRLAIALAAIGTLAAIGAAFVALRDESESTAANDAFYKAPEPLPNKPAGTILRNDGVEDAPGGMTASRILYLTFGFDGQLTAVSALVFLPLSPAPSNGRNVVVFAHGTVGVARDCAVSRGNEFFGEIDGLRRFIRAGYAVVVPDYAGLGTAGTHPYLIGPVTAHAALDAVRAVGRLGLSGASERFAVWGVGQGGHAALFTGQLAGQYAPELELAGVAAGAPMANLRRLVGSSSGTPAGDVLAANVLATWSRLYPRLRLSDVLTPASRATVDAVSQLCVPLDHTGPIGAALKGRKTALEYRTERPWDRAPWRELLAEHSPGGAPISAPVLITQGGADSFVRPSATRRFVRYLCSQGTIVQYRASRGVGHGELGERTAPFVSRWIAGRFAGDTARSAC